MNNNTSFRIISEFENATERDYLNEFLKFVGLFTYYDTLEDNSNKNWYSALSSSENRKGIDIVINYYGNDLNTNSNNKIYLYFDFDSLICGVSSKPLKHKEEALSKFQVDSKIIVRRKVLEDLINFAFPQNISEQLLTVIEAYVPKEESYNLYLAIQIAYGLSVLCCNEIQKDKEAQISKIFLFKYLETILSNLSTSYNTLEQANDSQNIYSLYAQIRIDFIKRMIVNFLITRDINVNCGLIPENILNEKLKKIHELDPTWISYFLCRASLSYGESIEDCYFNALNNISDIDKNRIAYASVLYEYGKHIEKEDVDKAIMIYKNAYKNNSSDYRALFEKIYLETLTNNLSNKAAIFELGSAIKQICSNHNVIENDNDESYQLWKYLSLTDSFYIWRILLCIAKLDIATCREYSVKIDIMHAIMAASCFENNEIISRAYYDNEKEIKDFLNYHQSSEYTWALWKILEPWANNCCQDPFIKAIVNDHLNKYALVHKFELKENSDKIKKKLN